MRPFLEALDERILVCDGAMGTMLYAKGVFINKSFEALNLTEPDLVADVHQAYARAGADVLETNTFGANRVKLTAFGLADQLHAINVQGVRIARHAAREDAYVAGAIGPLGIRVEPWGKTGVDEAEQYFREQAAALLEGGVDLFVLETFRDLNEIGAAVAAVRSLCDLPIVALMTTEEDGNSLDGTPPEQFAPTLERYGAHLIGVNCSVGPAPMLETLERMAAVTQARLAAQPNAGKPRDIEGRTIYLCSPEYMASYARRFIATGVRLVGGCCGTTPEHIREIKAGVRLLADRSRSTATSARPERVGVATAEAPQVPPVPLRAKSRMANALARGSFLVLVELQPPKGHRSDQIVEQARILKIRGVDVINIYEGPWSSARMSALSMAVLIEREAGLETLLRYSCRDRRLLGMQSDLLGAHAMGLRNLLIVTGDPPKAAEEPTARFDVDSIGLTNAVARLNRGLDIGGQPLGQPTAYHIGVVANPGALNLDEEIRRFEYKVEAGAEFAVADPVFDLRALETFLKRVEGLRIPIIAGVWPFESVLNAEFMANELPGVQVPRSMLERMRRTEGPEAALAEGIAIAREIAAEVKGLVQGLQISAPSANIDTALAVLEAIA